MKKKTLSLILMAVILLGTLLPAVGFAAEETGLKEVTILHINDTHGRAVEDAKNKAIGYAKFKTFADTQKDALIVDAGDTIHGTTFATISKGDAVVELMNQVGVDVFVPGNHDYNYGYPRLVELMKKAKFSPVQANVVEEKTNKEILPATVIKEVNGIKVGFFGIATPETRTKSSPVNTEGLVFLDYKDQARRAVASLKEQGAQATVGVVHLGIDESSKERSDFLAKDVPGIDVLIDGHSHTLLEKGMNVGSTLIAQAGEYFQHVGKLTLTFKDGALVNKKAEVLSYDDFAGVTPDAAVLETVKKVEEANRPYLERVVGNSEVLLEGTREKVRTGETNLGDLLADAMIDISGADVAITNGGGIRASIPAGQITMEQVITSFPFTNYPVKLEVKGDVILKALEFGVDKAPEVVGKFPQVGGMTFKYDPKQPAGSRVFEVLVKGQPLDVNKTYTLVTNDFMAIGGDGYDMLKGQRKLAEHPLLSEVLASYIAKKSPIKTIEGNRVVVAEKKAEPTAPQTFTDVDKHWAKTFIDDVVAKGLVQGMPPTTFEPNTKVSRAMVVTVLGRLDETIATLEGGDTPFTDVKDQNAWYAKYVAWAAKNGIVKGYEDNTFKPNGEVTRQELAAIIGRYLYTYKHITPKAGEAVTFTDEAKIAEWAKDDVKRLVEEKILSGREDKSFDPTATATRGELAKILSLVSDRVPTQKALEKAEAK